MTSRFLLATILCGTTVLGTGMAAHAAGPRYDTIIRGGTVIDGSGAPSYKADVAIVGDHIMAIGDLSAASAKTMIDATGMTVAPGFINIHSHAEPGAIATAVNMLTQGVTTEITNADGFGTTDITKQLAGFAANGLAENIGLYIGFNTVWQEIMGDADRRPSADQITTMQAAIDRNMAQGAWGVAAGLDYKPGYYARADEVTKIVSVARKWRTDFPNHDRLRPEDNFSSYKGMAETIAIAEGAGLMPVITHMKSQGRERGKGPAALQMMDEATARGIPTTGDVYPYLAGLSGLGSLIIPGWAEDGGRAAMLKRFADPVLRQKIIEETEGAMAARFGGPEQIYVMDTGQELTSVMAELNVRAGEAVIRLLEKKSMSAILRFGAEDDLVAFLRHPNVAISCDCGASNAAKWHPRQWGTFPRVLGQYVREKGVLSWEEAIRKMSALPAAILGMTDRGYLAPGMKADVVVFDPATVIDHATYESPLLPSEGVREVFVNGAHALRAGKATGAQGGKIVLKSRRMPSRPMLSPGGQAVKAAARNDRMSVSVSATQPRGARSATGSVSITDRASGQVWTADRLGMLQTTKDWASLTGTVRNKAGAVQPVTITIDRASQQPAALVVSLGDAPAIELPLR